MLKSRNEITNTETRTPIVQIEKRLSKYNKF